MGVHHAPRSSSHAARLAGRGAFTAAAALALTGGTASLAFAHEAPGTPSLDAQSVAHQARDSAADGRHQVRHSVADGQHQVKDAASTLPTSLSADPLSADPLSAGAAEDEAAVIEHGAATVKEKGAQVEHRLTTAAAPVSSKLPVSVPTDDVEADLGHTVDNTKNDVEHAQDNVTGAMSGGLTFGEGTEQADLVSDDVRHAVDNGRNDVGHWTGAATATTPTSLSGVLSFA